MFYSNNENAIEWLKGDENITVTLSDQHLWAVVRRLAKKYPDKVAILAEPKENGGYMHAHLPLSFLQIRDPGRQPEKSQEQVDRAKELMKVARQNLEGSRPRSYPFEQISPSNASEV